MELQKAFDSFIEFLETVLTNNGTESTSIIYRKLSNYKNTFTAKVKYEDHIDDVAKFFTKHRSDILAGHENDMWLRTGIVHIQFGDHKTKSEKYQLMLSHIYYKAIMMQDETDNYVTSKVKPADYNKEIKRPMTHLKLNYCKYFHLHLYRLLLACNVSASCLSSYITELEKLVGEGAGAAPPAGGAGAGGGPEIMDSIISAVPSMLSGLGIIPNDGSVDMGEVSNILRRLTDRNKMGPLMQKLTATLTGGSSDPGSAADAVTTMIRDGDNQNIIADTVDEIMPGKGKEALSVLRSPQVQQMATEAMSAIQSLFTGSSPAPPPAPTALITFDEPAPAAAAAATPALLSPADFSVPPPAGED